MLSLNSLSIIGSSVFGNASGLCHVYFHSPFSYLKANKSLSSSHFTAKKAQALSLLIPLGFTHPVIAQFFHGLLPRKLSIGSGTEMLKTSPSEYAKPLIQIINTVIQNAVILLTFIANPFPKIYIRETLNQHLYSHLISSSLHTIHPMPSLPSSSILSYNILSNRK